MCPPIIPSVHDSMLVLPSAVHPFASLQLCTLRISCWCFQVMKDTMRTPCCCHEHQALRTSWVNPCLHSSFCAMGVAEVTSISGSAPQMSPPMEATSHSEGEEGERPKCPGRGRRHGLGRGRAASSSTHPQPKRVINKSRGHQIQSKAKQPKTILSWLHQPTSQ